MTGQRSLWRLTLAFIVLLILIVIVADSGRGQVFFALLKAIPGGDKTGHFVLMGLASFLVNLSLSAARVQIGPLRLLKGSLIVAVVVTLEEASQLLFASRGASVLDLLVDYAGIILFGALAAWIVARRGSVVSS